MIEEIGKILAALNISFMPRQIDGALVVAVVVLLQLLKGLLRQLKVKTPKWLWKVIVVVAGFLAAAVYARRGMLVREYISSGVMYAAWATIVYQSGKLIVTPIFEKITGKKVKE